MDDTKPLSRWRWELQSIGKRHWPVFYQSMMGTPVSSYPRLYKAVDKYGLWPLFEAIIAASERTLNGDPLNYVLKLAHEKWKELEKAEDVDDEYLDEISKAKDISRRKNEALAEKLQRLERGSNA